MFDFINSVSVFALVLGSSGGVNAPGGFSLAYAGAPLPDAFADLAPMDAEALDNARGGFSVGNINVNVGVKVETSIDGFATVTTNFSVSMPGMLNNMGTEIKTITDTATAAAKAATEAATGIAAKGTGGNQTVNGQPVNPKPDSPPATEATGNTTVTDAMASLSDGIKQVNDGLKDIPPVAAAPAPAYDESLSGSDKPSVVSLVATGKPSASSTIPEAASIKVIGTSKNGDTLIVPANRGNMAEIIHDTAEGHTTVITNTLNNVTIRQTVSLNMTVENFSQLQTVSSLNRTVTSLSRQIGLLGLRH